MTAGRGKRLSPPVGGIGMSMEKRIIRILDKTLDTAILLVCLLLLFIGAYSMLDELWLYENAADRSALMYKPEIDRPLEENNRISKNHIAWLTIDDTEIDYPIMQGEDNYEYLNKDPYGEFSLSGSIFLDSRNSPDFTDPYSVIYGHHMERGVMFGSLDMFKDRSYFDEHTTGLLTTGDTVYNITLFAVTSAEATDSTLFDPQGRTMLEVTDFLKENATIYNEPEEDRRIIALSTCAGDTYYERLLVFGTIRER